ncbi:MAG: hypothetical protein GEU91_05765 [Rhizobiales bacterium]|nr:hypothetical protein [Hyphomicrobiales bacterium]
MTQTSQTADSSRGGGLTAAVALACVAFLAFIVGGFTMYRGLFPANTLRGAFQGGIALYDQLTAYNDPVDTDFWKLARTPARGVVRHDPQRAQQGLTLYTSGHDQRALLIDMNGRVAHQWSLPYSRVWDKSSAVARPRPDAFVHIEKAHVFPNGDLLALYTAVGDTPWGYGLVKMDKNSNVIWKYLAHAHHDFTFDSAGNIYVLTHEISKADIPGFGHLKKPRIDDFIVKLSPDGLQLEKTWLTGVVTRSSFGRRLNLVPHNDTGDYLHTNSVHVLDKAVPGIPQSRAGQVLVSMREISTIALVDLTSSRVVWASSGPWVRQHDAEFLPNGRLLLFDNEGDPNEFGSRVLEIDPATFKVKWSYGGRADQPLDSAARASQSRLANGNTLIVESWAGRLLEVTPKGDIVWEFVNPVRGGPREDRIPIIHWVTRLDPQRDFTSAFFEDLRLE